MNEIIVDGTIIRFNVRYIAKNKYTFRARNGILLISAPPYSSMKDIEKAIVEKIDKLKPMIEASFLQEIIHYNGIAYKPVFHIGKEACYIINDEIHLFAKTNTLAAYTKVLHQFYLETLKNEVSKIINEAINDFKEIKFPTIKFKYMKTMFGNYYRKSNIVNLSTMLAKYNFLYIKSVLYHELTHTIVFNHSERFYALYAKKYPNASAIQKKLKSIKYNDCL